MSEGLPSLEDSAGEKPVVKKEESLIVNDLSKEEEFSELIIPEDRQFNSIMSDEMEADEKGPSKKSLKKERKLQRYLDMKAARKLAIVPF